MRTVHKYYKDRDFTKNSNISFDLRMDDSKKTKDWTPEEKAEAVTFLNQCITDIERYKKSL